MESSAISSSLHKDQFRLRLVRWVIRSIVAVRFTIAALVSTLNMSELPFQTKAMKRLDEIERRLLESTPELRDQLKKSPTRQEYSTKDSRPPTSGSGKARPQVSANALDIQNKTRELEELLADERRKGSQLAREMENRQLRYVKREQEYRKALLDYETELRSRSVLSKVALNEATYKHLERIGKMHDQIIGNIGTVQSKTSIILDEQERDITRDFNSELDKLMRELEEEKQRKIEGVGSFAEKEARLRTDLERMKVRIELVEQSNKALHKRNRELKIELNSQKGDRELLTTQIEDMEGGNDRLRSEIERFKEEAQGLGQSADSPQAEEVRSRTAPHFAGREGLETGKAQRYEKIIAQLKRMIEAKRKQTREVTTSLGQIQGSRTELEGMLREVVSQVKEEVRAQGDIRKRGGEELSVQDRERVVETLLSQEHVLTLLYDKTFPPRADETLSGSAEL